MTLLNMIEIIGQSFPDKKETQIKIDLNSAYRMYSEETRLPFLALYVTVESNVLVITPTPLQRSKGWYALPQAVKNIVTVTAMDSRNNEIQTVDYRIETIGRMFQVIDLSGKIFSGDGLPSPVATLRFGCTIEPAALTALSDVPDFPEPFHQALVDHVLAKYNSFKGVLQNSGWFRSSYAQQVAAGKRYFNRHQG